MNSLPVNGDISAISDAELPANLPSALLPWVTSLNPPQREAVLSLDGPVLVLAGAGTGKTKVLTTRLAHVVMAGHAHPQEVMAVTFTNKAAREMSHRVEQILQRPSAGMWLGTFHSLSARILRKWAERVGLKSSFTILDDDDQLRLIKQLVEAMNLDEKSNPARLIAAIIDGWKNKGWTPAQVPSGEAGHLANGKLIDLYRDYQARLLTLNACDFGDLLLHTLTLLKEHEDVRTELQHRFRYILVDEYQDTNVAQYLWLRLLAQHHRNVCCVGDDDQSIFSWRGAEVGNILRFEKDFPGAKVIRLEQNYRSTGHILGAAGGIIAQNRDRLGKTLWTDADEGEKVRLRSLWDGEDEARWVGEEIEALQRQKVELSDVAILVRAGFQTREFEERFIKLGIPYKVLGGARFYERQEIRDALAYLRIVMVPEDDLALGRIINVPKRGIGVTTLQKLQALSRVRQQPLLRVIEDIVQTDEFPARARKPLAELAAQLETWRRMLHHDPLPDKTHVELARRVLDESGYTTMWQQENSPEAQGRLENLKELVSAMAEFDTLEGFLEHVSLVMEAAEDNSVPKVTLMTLHASKGLEFHYVFLPGWEEEIFPSRRTLEESGPQGLEEERRLAYVGLTRARVQAFVSYVSTRRVYGNTMYPTPSRFVREIPAEHTIEETDPGMFSQPASYGSFGTEPRDYTARNNLGRGPGYQRMANKWTDSKQYGVNPPVIESTVRELVVETEEGAVIYAPGARVFHDKFGYGTVASARGDLLEIRFDHSGMKKVIASFVKAA